MAIQKKEWTYFDEEKGDWVTPYLTRSELDSLHDAGRIQDYTQVVNIRRGKPRPGTGITGVSYIHLGTIDVEFDPQPEDFLALRSGKSCTVLSGPNNGGKSLFLKHLYSYAGHESYLVACNRFSQIDVLSSRQRDENEHAHRYENFIHTFQTAHNNSEDNELKFDQLVTVLKDRQRKKLFETAGHLLGNKFDLVRTDPENEFSPFFVSMDGENLRYGSSGTRLLLTLLGILLEERFSTILIDEPEIGLSPRIQTVLANFLYNQEERQQFCPHVKQLHVVTHSHLFLDRKVFGNNFVVTKQGKLISVRQVQSVSDLFQLQFNMLGNELESLFLPSAIVIVEGDSDATFLSKVVELHIPGRRVAMVRAQGEGEIMKKINFFKEAFGDMASSLYRARLLVVYDEKMSSKLGRLENQGVLKDNTIVLKKNGIEYYYPPELVAEAYACDVVDVGKISLENDPIDHNGLRHSKKDLAVLVANALTAAHSLHPEVEALVQRLRAVCV